MCLRDPAHTHTEQHCSQMRGAYAPNTFLRVLHKRMGLKLLTPPAIRKTPKINSSHGVNPRSRPSPRAWPSACVSCAGQGERVSTRLSNKTRAGIRLVFFVIMHRVACDIRAHDYYSTPECASLTSNFVRRQSSQVLHMPRYRLDCIHT